MTASEEQQARTNQFVNESIESMTGRGFNFHYNQPSQSAEHDEEEEDDRTPQIARTPSSFAMRQNTTVSPTNTSQMVSDKTPHNQLDHYSQETARTPE